MHVGKFLVLFGIVLVVVGILFQVVGKVPGTGRLPGDIVFKHGPVTFYFPIVTSVIVSIVLSLLLSVFWRR